MLRVFGQILHPCSSDRLGKPACDVKQNASPPRHDAPTDESPPRMGRDISKPMVNVEIQERRRAQHSTTE